MSQRLLEMSKVKLYLALADTDEVRPWITQDVSKIHHFPARIRSGDPEIDNLSTKEADIWSSAQKWLAQKRPVLKQSICDKWGYCSRRTEYGDDHDRLVRDVATQIRDVIGPDLAELVASILFKESLFSLCECGDIKSLMKEATEAYEKGEFNERTFSMFAHITDLDPDNHRAHYYQGSIRLKQHRYDLAKPHYLTAMALSPSDGVYLNDLAYIYGTVGMELELAQDYAALALKMYSEDPVNRPACLDTLGTVLSRRGKHDEALPYLLESLRLVRSRSGDFDNQILQEVLYHVAVAYHGLRNEERLDEIVREIRAIDSTSYWAEKVKEW